MTVVRLPENCLFLHPDACSQLLKPSSLYHKILSSSPLRFIPVPMTKEDKSCACPPTPEATDPGPVLFGIGCQMATLTATAMAMGKLGSISSSASILTSCTLVGAHRSEIHTVERLHYLENETRPFAATRAKSITFEFYDHGHAPPLFTAPRDLTIDDCVHRLTTGVCYSDAHKRDVGKVVYSIPSSRAASPPPSPEVPTRPVSPTESSISATHSDYDDLADQLNQTSMTGMKYSYD